MFKTLSVVGGGADDVFSNTPLDFDISYDQNRNLLWPAVGYEKFDSNRVAASRCHSKRKVWVQGLEEELQVTQKGNADLRSQVAMLPCCCCILDLYHRS
ncbi:hypothetical protein K432DRAFT_68095 [Lepidopterella palustris CBS 459.81]|uniref:BZIP domain-containing protein n=1 Tax=Lepidopterella palustris CBS 459.81 TaxID=1314670 RepID=A0A8E2E8R7_9PEZI|nr:hypothetical protein K432DRAFT_68095 [Lepidopterella palustris CBS 459.81]